MTPTCPYCRGPLETVGTVACVRCATCVHADCARLHGRCVTFGCPGLRFAPGRLGTQRTHLSPSLPWRVRARGSLRALWEVALAPAEETAAWALGLAGLLEVLLTR